MLYDLLTVSGAVFWIIIAIVVALDIGLLSGPDDEPGVVGVVATTLVFLFMLMFSDAFVGWSLLGVAALVVAYLIVGTAWSMWKWYNYLVCTRTQYQKTYHERTDRPMSLAKYLSDNRPKASSHKAKLTNWITLWPFSLSWWILTWPRRAAAWIYDRLSTVYDRMSYRVFGG